MNPKTIDFTRFEESLRSQLGPGVPSVAYGIARGGETLCLGAAGRSNVEAGDSANIDTSYALASITKPMTATVVAMLAERGDIDIDAPINEYLGEAKIDSRAGDAQDATIRRVADHTAGLPLHYQFYYSDEPYRRPPIDETIRRYAKTFTPPGERHLYSNLGYGLLESVIERTVERSYPEAMEEALFGPLGMSRSYIGPIRPKGRNIDEAIPYGTDGIGYPSVDFDHPGGSAAFSTIQDLLRFGNFHLGYGPDLLSRENRQAMQYKSVDLSEGRGYGFGWGMNEDRFGVRYVQHTGGMGGVTTILRLVPALDLVIGVVINGESGLPMLAADDALALFDSGFKQGLDDHRQQPAKSETKASIPKSLFGIWEGGIETFEGDRKLELRISKGETVAFLDGKEAKVEQAEMASGYLSGVFDGDVRTSDSAKRPYQIRLDLKLRDDALCGAIATVPEGKERGGSPEKRAGNALCYWTELRRYR
jgi:CubicO group peptidase (beta-lactamase class C family)